MCSLRRSALACHPAGCKATAHDLAYVLLTHILDERMLSIVQARICMRLPGHMRG